jgi:uncharacterized protein with PIN domain
MEEEKCHKCNNIIRFIPDGKIQERKKMNLCDFCHKVYENSLEYNKRKK